jgi:NAD(P)-dependent dehydrogenase (short-subunit alcohol dehydrogenase family)
MKNIVVTGGSGKAGGAVIKELIEHGYSVLNVDVAPPTNPICTFLKVDLTDFGQAIDALRAAAGVGDHPFRTFEKADSVIHLAAIRAAEHFIIAAADTVMTRPNKELLAETFPIVPVTDEIGEFETLLSISRDTPGATTSSAHSRLRVFSDWGCWRLAKASASAKALMAWRCGRATSSIEPLPAWRGSLTLFVAGLRSRVGRVYPLLAEPGQWPY